MTTPKDGTTKKRKGVKVDVYERLRRAYKANRGCRLTADDVDTLLLMNTATIDVVAPDREGITP